MGISPCRATRTQVEQAQLTLGAGDLRLDENGFVESGYNFSQ